MPMRIVPSNLVRHPLGLVGVWLTTVSALLFLVFFAFNLLGYFANPYLGIVFFLVLPVFFVVGLLLMPLGAWLDRRAVERGRALEAARWPIWNLNDPRVRHLAFFIAAATVVNVVVFSLATYSGVEYMDSVPFCGRVCHQVMKPEFTAYQEGPHARVPCVQCHIGPGAPWFVRSKLSGTRQVFAVMLNTYPRPIPSPVQNLRPARETCEQCHWPEIFTGDRVDVIRDYASDEANTESTTTLRMHVGGANPRRMGPHDIHWHIAVLITYITTDRQRQTIPFVKVQYPNGEVREFRAAGVSATELARGEPRTMDCMDCHNRPSHPFAPTAGRAIDDELAEGSMPRTLPFVRQQAVELVEKPYPSQEAALEAIAAGLLKYYREQQPQVFAARRADVEQAVAAAQHAYLRNVFPHMKVTWGTYLNNLGHMYSLGCFRCHDDAHTSKDGKVIPQDCDLCHDIVQ
jgi:hypothetical protein